MDVNLYIIMNKEDRFFTTVWDYDDQTKTWLWLNGTHGLYVRRGYGQHDEMATYI